MNRAMVVAAGALMISAAQPAPRFALRGGCVLPYAAYAPTRDALYFCDNAGRRAGQPPPALPDRLRLDAQNNLCAPAGAPVPMSHREFSRLPAVDPHALLTSRKRLAAIAPLPGRADVGEGTVVRIAGIISTAHVAGCDQPAPGERAGEPVTCHFLGGPTLSEMQLNLSPMSAPRDTPDCDTVVAKMIVHYRPIWWDEIDIKTPDAPVRITGQLFYDETATACPRGGSARSTPWEIHPVYAIDVCTAASPGECDPAAGRFWQPHHQWVDRPDARVRATGTAERIRCREASLKWLASQHGPMP